MMKKPTSSDVAKFAGVSQAAVSLILNGSDKISFSQETRERVFAAAQQLGYKLPPRKKREKNEPNIIMVFTPTLTNPYYSELVQHVEEYVAPKGYHVMVCNTFRNQNLEKYYLDTAQQARNVAGIIYSFLPSFPELAEQISRTVPTVIIGEKNEELALCSVGLNNANAGVLLTEHLYQLGHRDIAFLSTPLGRFTLARSQRLEGIRRQMAVYGIEDRLQIVVSQQQEQDYGPQGAVPFEFAIGRQLTEQILKSGSKATAFIGVNDMTALGIMAELTESGYQVGRDYSVCGFDNIFATSVTACGITTIEHHLRARCHAAADMVINRGASEHVDSSSGIDLLLVKHIEYAPRIMVRGSTGAVKIG